jgi:hypothetical protein
MDERIPISCSRESGESRKGQPLAAVFPVAVGGDAEEGGGSGAEGCDTVGEAEGEDGGGGGEGRARGGEWGGCGWGSGATDGEGPKDGEGAGGVDEAGRGWDRLLSLRFPFLRGLGGASMWEGR